MSLVYGSVCSGIEAATVAWHPLGWRPAFFSEIEAFPRSVLAHHWPDVPLHGDFTTIEANTYEPIDLLVGGTPCQAFSIAGLRKGLADERGNLTLEFVRLAQRLRPRWLVWENVPGVLSIDGGRAFGTFLGGLAELGYGFAYRVLDAQHFGVPQRRRRVFVVGHLGDWSRAAAVLFERHSLSGHPAPRRETGKAVAVLTSSGVGTCGADDNQGQGEHLIPVGIDGGSDISHALTASQTASQTATGRLDPSMQTYVAHTLRAEGFDASEDGTGRGTPLVPIAFHPTQYPISSTDICHALGTGSKGGQASAAICFNMHKSGNKSSTLGIAEDRTDCLRAFEKSPFAVQHTSGVRRLTPEECEALQGFPRSYTLVPHRGKPAADGPRYKSLGNSMAVPVMAWIGERIQLIDKLTR